MDYDNKNFFFLAGMLIHELSVLLVIVNAIRLLKYDENCLRNGGIISHELAHTSKDTQKSKKCPSCYDGDYSEGDKFCSKCGTLLER